MQSVITGASHFLLAQVSNLLYRRASSLQVSRHSRSFVSIPPSAIGNRRPAPKTFGVHGLETCATSKGLPKTEMRPPSRGGPFVVVLHPMIIAGLRRMSHTN